MPVYLSSQSFSAVDSHGVLILCAVIVGAIALYLDIVKGQGE